MKRIHQSAFLLLLLFISACHKEQFKGSHLSDSDQSAVEKKTVSYHEKEANRVIDENQKNRKSNENHREKRRKQQEASLAELNKINTPVKKVKKRTLFTFY